MSSRISLFVAALTLGCGDDDSGLPDVTDAPGEEFSETGPDDTVAQDDTTPPDDAVAPDDAVVPDEAAPDDTAAPDDSSDDVPTDTDDDTTVACGPHWHPTSCGDCGGTWAGDTCAQGCDPASCGDGREYVAECDGTTHTCRCSIDGVEVCTCTSTYGVDVMGCQPEEWGGAICCWNVG